MKRTSFLKAVLACFALSVSAESYGADPANLEEGIPTQLEDAVPLPYQERQIQGRLSYEKTDEEQDRTIIEPFLGYGFAPNWQGKVSVPVLVGDADRTGSGDVRISVMYGFMAETDDVPAFAISGEVQLPTGKRSEGVDTVLKILASKKLLRTEAAHRFHFNLAWEHNVRPVGDEERDDMLRGAVGVDMEMGPDSVFVVDLVRTQGREKDSESNELEAGLRHRLAPELVFAAGAAVGFAAESPEFRLTSGLQYSF